MMQAFLKVIQFVPDPALKEPKHLPCLELDSGVQFFMSDAAVKFLMSEIEEDSNARNVVCCVTFLYKGKILEKSIILMFLVA